MLDLWCKRRGVDISCVEGGYSTGVKEDVGALRDVCDAVNSPMDVRVNGILTRLPVSS